MLPILLDVPQPRTGSLFASALTRLDRVVALARDWGAAGGPALFVFEAGDGCGALVAAGEGACPADQTPEWPACVPAPWLGDPGMALARCRATGGRHLSFPIFAHGQLEAALVTAAFDGEAKGEADLRSIELRRLLSYLSAAMREELERRLAAPL